MTLRPSLYSTVASIAIVLGTAGLANAVELSVLIPSGPDDVAKTEALTAAYTAMHPDVTFDIELRAGGGPRRQITPAVFRIETARHCSTWSVPVGQGV